MTRAKLNIMSILDEAITHLRYYDSRETQCSQRFKAFTSREIFLYLNLNKTVISI